MLFLFPDDGTPFQLYANTLEVWAGTDTIDPPLQFPPPEFGGPVLEFSAWSEVSKMCGDSRVWGGLHFEVSAPASKWQSNRLLQKVAIVEPFIVFFAVWMQACC